MRHCGHQAQNLAKTVIHGRRTAYYVVFGQFHAIAHEKPVVHNIPMGQTCCLWGRGRAGCKLDAGDIVLMEDIVLFKILVLMRVKGEMIVSKFSIFCDIHSTRRVVNE